VYSWELELEFPILAHVVMNFFNTGQDSNSNSQVYARLMCRRHRIDEIYRCVNCVLHKYKSQRQGQQKVIKDSSFPEHRHQNPVTDCLCRVLQRCRIVDYASGMLFLSKWNS